jgi:molecular chaperone GrpE
LAKKTEQDAVQKTAQAEASEAAAEESQEGAGEAAVETQLREELAQTQEQVKIQQEQYVRALADMENLRKRHQREKEDLAKYGNEGLLREILPVIDNLERALEHAEQGEGQGGLMEGVQMTLNQFYQVLSKFGVEPIDAVGQTFDPAFHQAMGQLESADQPVNTVVQQMQKGYLLNQRLLRPAFVMVAKSPPDLEQKTEPDVQADKKTTDINDNEDET